MISYIVLSAIGLLIGLFFFVESESAIHQILAICTIGFSFLTMCVASVGLQVLKHLSVIQKQADSINRHSVLSEQNTARIVQLFTPPPPNQDGQE